MSIISIMIQLHELKLHVPLKKKIVCVLQKKFNLKNNVIYRN